MLKEKEINRKDYISDLGDELRIILFSVFRGEEYMYSQVYIVINEQAKGTKQFDDEHKAQRYMDKTGNKYEDKGYNRLISKEKVN
jgi:hypothetical protein